jgi:hypothetical protein
MRAGALVVLLSAVTVSACELSEITLASADDVVVAEVVLRAESRVQTAYLHRTATDRANAQVLDATVLVTEEGTSNFFEFSMAADSLCLDNRPLPTGPTVGTCYVARGDSTMVRPGGRYELSIQLDDGREMTGITTVPERFAITSPSARPCRLPANTLLEMQWTSAAGTAVYIISTRLFGLKQALRERGVPSIGDDPVELVGLSVSAADSTLSFPDELGLFNRFDDELHAILLAIRSGLPPGVRAVGVVAAADRNYVNWVRGGTFNPSGVVRIPSIQGDGYGVFGSMTVEDFEMRTSGGSTLPSCL